VFGLGEEDVVMKINIPMKERLKVLKLLDAHNLNAFSLFGTEESLVETMAIRELESSRTNVEGFWQPLTKNGVFQGNSARSAN
jgi:hypothetical protein